MKEIRKKERKKSEDVRRRSTNKTDFQIKKKILPNTSSRSVRVVEAIVVIVIAQFFFFFN